MTNKDESSLDKEISKATGQVIVETAKDVRAILGKIFGVASTEFGAMLGDQMRFWRFKNLNRILGKVEEISQKRGIHPESLKTLPFGDAVRAIEASSYEEEESVQDLWARLIANAVDPRKNIGVKKMYVDILRSISSAEAAFLNLLWECEKRNQFHGQDEVEKFNTEMNIIADRSWRSFPADVRKAAIQNLIRIRCVTFRPRPINLDRLFAQLPRDQVRPFDRWSLVDPERFQKMIEQIGDLIFVSAGVKEHQETAVIPLSVGPGNIHLWRAQLQVPEMNYMFTPLGVDLMRACELNNENVET